MIESSRGSATGRDLAVGNELKQCTERGILDHIGIAIIIKYPGVVRRLVIRDILEYLLLNAGMEDIFGLIVVDSCKCREEKASNEGPLHARSMMYGWRLFRGS